MYRLCNRNQDATRTMQEAMSEFQGSPEEIRLLVLLSYDYIHYRTLRHILSGVSLVDPTPLNPKPFNQQMRDILRHAVDRDVLN